MTLIELLTFLTLLFCGGLIGAGMSGAIGFLRDGASSDSIAHGGLIGTGLTFFGLFALAAWVRKRDLIHPPCKCGRSDWKDFESGRAEGITNVWQCTCGKLYSWPKWGLWFEIDDQGTVHLYMKRDFWGRWKKAAQTSKYDNLACARRH